MRLRQRARAVFHFRNSPGLVEQSKNFAGQALGRQFGLRDQPGRAGVRISSALRSLMASVAAPKGMKMAARPAAATSATVIAPERQTIKSAWANRSAMFSMKGRTSALNSRRA